MTNLVGLTDAVVHAKLFESKDCIVQRKIGQKSRAGRICVACLTFSHENPLAARSGCYIVVMKAIAVLVYFLILDRSLMMPSTLGIAMRTWMLLFASLYFVIVTKSFVRIEDICCGRFAFASKTIANSGSL